MGILKLELFFLLKNRMGSNPETWDCEIIRLPLTSHCPYFFSIIRNQINLCQLTGYRPIKFYRTDPQNLSTIKHNFFDKKIFWSAWRWAETLEWVWPFPDSRGSGSISLGPSKNEEECWRSSIFHFASIAGSIPSGGEYNSWGTDHKS